MNSENAENRSDSSNGRALKIRAVAATVLEELGQVRSAGPVGQEALVVGAGAVALVNRGGQQGVHVGEWLERGTFGSLPPPAAVFSARGHR